MKLLGNSTIMYNTIRRVRKACLLRLRPKPELTRPVFIVGAHRCGTSMTLEAFSRSDYSVSYEQVDSRAYDNQMLRDEQKIHCLLDRSRADVVAFKPLRQNQHIRRFLDVFPSLRVVWLVRNYRAAALSAAKQWTSIHGSFEQFLAGDGMADWRFEGLTDRQYRVVKDYFSPRLSLASAHALFWYVRSSYYFEHGLDQDDRVGPFFYEDLTANPSSAFKHMMEFCSCRLDRKCFQHVNVVSSQSNKFDAEINHEIAALCEQLLVRFKMKISAEPPTCAKLPSCSV